MLRSSCSLNLLKTGQREKAILVVEVSRKPMQESFSFVSERFKNKAVFSSELKHNGINWVNCLDCAFLIVPKNLK